MNRAVEVFSELPKTCNCAQAVAVGLGHEELKAELAMCGGGRAPEGRCGALHAALRLTPAEEHESIKAEFRRTAGSEFCRELKGVYQYPCVKCVELAAKLAEAAIKKTR
ncbi:MAG: hypothetical protein PHI35_07200 [Victivallaceae bacterium]|nr:hypothetical protein [Victivallaceae bacterium]